MQEAKIMHSAVKSSAIRSLEAPEALRRQPPVQQPRRHAPGRKPAKRWLAVPVAVWALAVYLIVNLLLRGLRSGPLNLYLVQPLLWSSLAALAFFGWRYGVSPKPRLNSSLIVAAGLAGAFQVAVFLIAGLLSSFGQSPYAHRILRLLGNLIYITTMLVGMEMSRACLVRIIARRNLTLGLILVTVLYSVLNIHLNQFTTLRGEPAALFSFCGATLLPTLSENLLASFLALAGGPLPAIAYRGIPVVFEWLSPILPDLSWPVTTFVGSVTPALGLLIIWNQYVTRRAGRVKASPHEGQSPTVWLLVAVITAGLVWFNNGFFGVRPTLVTGMSMSPTLETGDIVITRDIPAETVQVGDIIRFRDEAAQSYVIHRVLVIETEGGRMQFITQGDGNNAPDPPVRPGQLEGKVVLVVPKLGWLSIKLRGLIAWAV
jgi:signal peptidase